MRQSKYVGFTSGNWICVHAQLTNVQGKRSARPGHTHYDYIWVRRTSDDKADKLVRLNSTEAARVYRGEITVEELVNIRETKKDLSTLREISYHFS